MRDFSSVQRVVVKIGTNVLRSANGGIDTVYIREFAEQVCTLVSAGKQLVVVTSGAIGMGAAELGIGGQAAAGLRSGRAAYPYEHLQGGLLATQHQRCAGVAHA